MEFAVVYVLGALLYGAIEILWRGYTHWTMLICGGACFTLMYLISLTSLPLWAKWLFSASVITAVEFCTGCLVNITLGWQVWDYSAQPMNIMGQVCPLYSLFWFLLSVPGTALCTRLSSVLPRLLRA